MAEKSTIARPYAQAAFDLAQESGELKKWSEMLQLIAAITSDALMQDMISNPSIEREKVLDIIFGVCADKLNDTGKNFVKVLAENDRLNVVSVHIPAEAFCNLSGGGLQELYLSRARYYGG